MYSPGRFLIGYRQILAGLSLIACLGACDDSRQPHPRSSSAASDAHGAVASNSVPRELAWDDLIPKSWDPSRALADNDVQGLEDSDPRAHEAMSSLRQAWDNAPVDAALHGTHVRIPGFVVPLETVSRNVTEFLLVPYFGACVHMPPPPANQIVHVSTRPGGRKIETMDAVWVSGIIETVQNQTWMGNSGYRIAAATVEAYHAPRR